MKRTVRVVSTKEFEIDIPDHLLTDNHIAEFESCMFLLEDGLVGRSKIVELFKYAATQIAQYDSGFIEGLGQSVPEHLKQFADVADPVTYREIDSFIETETL